MWYNNETSSPRRGPSASMLCSASAIRPARTNPSDSTTIRCTSRGSIGSPAGHGQMRVLVGTSGATTSSSAGCSIVASTSSSSGRSGTASSSGSSGASDSSGSSGTASTSGSSGTCGSSSSISSGMSGIVRSPGGSGRSSSVSGSSGMAFGSGPTVPVKSTSFSSSAV